MAKTGYDGSGLAGKRSHDQRKATAQALNTGYGATKVDLERGYLKVNQPPLHDISRPQREPFFSGPQRGFVNRSPYSDERS